MTIWKICVVIFFIDQKSMIDSLRVESDFKAPNLPLSLRFKGSGCPSVRIAYISDSYKNIHIVDDNFSVYLCTMDILGSIKFCCFTESVSYFFL
jgi:hypothetical protein